MQSQSTSQSSQTSPSSENHDAVVAGPPELPTQAEIQAWLVAYLSELLEIDPDAIDVNDALAAYGLDSSGAAGMMGDLGEWLGHKLDPELLYSYPTIAILARYLVSAGGQ